MRYPQGGGLTDVERDARERVRRQAVTCFETGGKNREIAAMLRVSERSVGRWRRQWREGGYVGVASKGSPGREVTHSMPTPERQAAWRSAGGSGLPHKGALAMKHGVHARRVVDPAGLGMDLLGPPGQLDVVASSFAGTTALATTDVMVERGLLEWGPEPGLTGKGPSGLPRSASRCPPANAGHRCAPASTGPSVVPAWPTQWAPPCPPTHSPLGG
nr:helix-turn-helix domain-containing protein [Streptomyces sp. NBC_01022]